MRFVILNYSNLEYVKSICDNLFKIANKRPTVINYNDDEIPNCDLIILPDEFLGLEKIIKKVSMSSAIKQVKNHIARGGAVLGINSGAEVLITARLINAEIRRFNTKSTITKKVNLKIQNKSISPFLSMYRESEVIELNSKSFEDQFILKTEPYKKFKNQELVAFNYNINNQQKIKNSTITDDNKIAAIMTENGKVLCSIPDPTILEKDEIKNDSKIFFENIIQTLS